MIYFIGGKSKENLNILNFWRKFGKKMLELVKVFFDVDLKENENFWKNKY